MPLDINILGEGIYTPKQAARLIGSTPQSILRWTRGSGPSEPLWKAHYHGLDDTTELSFADLVEVRVVSSFRAAGISLQAIRFAIGYARKLFGQEHPLSTLGFKTDGKEVLIEALDRDDHHISLSKKNPGQRVFTDIVKQSLNDLEYEEEVAARWRPHFSKNVLVDPARQFGAPILDEFGISTKMIFDEFRLFGDAKYLSQIYGVPLSFIKNAIHFEEFLENRLKREDGQSSV